MSLWNKRAGDPGLPQRKVDGLEEVIGGLDLSGEEDFEPSVATVTPESPAESVHRFWTAAWWPVAAAVTAVGADCTVLDPDAEASESFFDGNEDHGVVTVHPHSGLGWVLAVSETDAEMSEAEFEAEAGGT